MKNVLNRSLRVLIVEDNPGDVRLIKEAFLETDGALSIAVAKDGIEALEYLFRRGAFESAWQPDLMMLDLNLPKKSGHEVLAAVKADANLKNIPVIVFSSSSAPNDVTGAYGQGANCYVTKPTDLDELFLAISWIDKFWLSSVRLPSETKSAHCGDSPMDAGMGVRCS